MSTDTKWTWTILIREGKSIHIPLSITLEEALKVFYDMGNHQTEIEAIIRH